MAFPTLDMIKFYASLGCDIKPYVAFGSITKEQFKALTGEEYSA